MKQNNLYHIPEKIIQPYKVMKYVRTGKDTAEEQPVVIKAHFKLDYIEDENGKRL